MDVYRGVVHENLERENGAEGKILVAIESTDDWTGPGFYARLVDSDIQNADGSYGKVQESYRIACIDCAGSRKAHMCALDARQFLSAEAARAVIEEDAGLRLVTYDEMVHQCMNSRNRRQAERNVDDVIEVATKACEELNKDLVGKCGFAFEK